MLGKVLIEIEVQGVCVCVGGPGEQVIGWQQLERDARTQLQGGRGGGGGRG